MPVDAEDERLRKRLVQVLKPTTSCYRESSEEEKEPGTTWVMSAKLGVARTNTTMGAPED
jgi:hypothetical protein